MALGFGATRTAQYCERPSEVKDRYKATAHGMWVGDRRQRRLGTRARPPEDKRSRKCPDRFSLRFRRGRYRPVALPRGSALLLVAGAGRYSNQLGQACAWLPPRQTRQGRNRRHALSAAGAAGLRHTHARRRSGCSSWPRQRFSGQVRDAYTGEWINAINQHEEGDHEGNLVLTGQYVLADHTLAGSVKKLTEDEPYETVWAAGNAAWRLARPVAWRVWRVLSAVVEGRNDRAMSSWVSPASSRNTSLVCSPSSGAPVRRSLRAAEAVGPVGVVLRTEAGSAR